MLSLRDRINVSPLCYTAEMCRLKHDWYKAVLYETVHARANSTFTMNCAKADSREMPTVLDDIHHKAEG